MIIRAVLSSVFVQMTVQATPTSAQDNISQTRIGLRQGAELARQLLISGQPDAALQIAQTLVQARPNDMHAHVLFA
jgi:hypothetical protein